jgi:hypothetical protein
MVFNFNSKFKSQKYLCFPYPDGPSESHGSVVYRTIFPYGSCYTWDMGSGRVGLGGHNLVILWRWHLGSLCHDAHGLLLDGGAHLGNVDGTLLELLGELLVQEVADDQDGNQRHDIEDIEWALRLYLTDSRTLDMINNWNSRLHY